MTWKNMVLAGVALIVSLPAFAEDTTTLTATAAPATSKFVGSIDLRPSVHTKIGSNTTEDTLEAGYQFAPNRIVTVVQYFETNLKNPDPDAERGLNLAIYDTFIRTRLNKIAHLGEGLDFSYQSRIFLPVSQDSRDRGMIATFRNYLTLTQKINDTLTLSLSELPILSPYSRAGIGEGDKAKANPVFENRVYLIGDIQISEKLSLSIPIMFHQTKYSTFLDGAKNNGAWSYFLWTYPELTYELTSNTSVGLAYYSSNLVKADLSGLSIGDGLEDGVLQGVFGASF